MAIVTARWWRLLSWVATANVGIWLLIWWLTPVGNPYVASQLALSGIYVVVCAYRSFYPRIDLERRVLVDSHLSSILLGRSAATIAEICFGIQLGLLLYLLGDYAGLPWVQQAAWVVPICTAAAQVFCWHSILTLNHIGQAVEEFFWAVGMSWLAALLAVVAHATQGPVQYLAIGGILASLAFTAYVLVVDIPMYIRRFRRHRARGRRYLCVRDGLRDAWCRREEDTRWEKWRDDAAWLTPYFTLGVWFSLGLVLVPGAL